MLQLLSKQEQRAAIAQSLKDNHERIIEGRRYLRCPPDETKGGYWGKTQYSVKKHHRTGNCPSMKGGWRL